MAVRHLVRVFVAFGLGYLMFATIWRHAVWHEYYCLWPGLPHLSHRMAAVRPLARLSMPLAWVSSSLVIWLYAVWREHHCLWPGSPHLCHRMAVRRMARVLLPLAWVYSSLVSYGCMPYGASIAAFGCTPSGSSGIAFGLGYLIFAIVWL